ncbi:MFS general substrate transporter [Polyplosphaeria fusca]|uniref:MFS general substrate transporter n=1 Tax=Polyplosphaeria fusca TaxID=682080 RepID=A0A9P4QVI7_9PLEO|nr:MFS general substrate transporter [Polyplosphaeria fusca]
MPFDDKSIAGSQPSIHEETDNVESKSIGSKVPSSLHDDVENTAKTSTPAITSGAPNGGTAAWLVVFGAWCVSFCSWGWLNSIGVFQQYYDTTLLSDYSPSTVAWIPSLQVFLISALGPVIGALFDRYGPRYLMLVGTILHVFGIMMTSLGTQYYQIFLAQGLCSALGVSAIFQPSVNSVAGWFDKRRGLAFGVVFTGSSIGGVVFPIMITHLIATIGFAWALRTSGFLILLLLIPANLTIRTYQPPRPYAITRDKITKPFKEPPFVLIAAGFFCLSYGFFCPINFIPSEAEASGMDPNLVQYLLPLLNAASLFGRLASGFLADRLGRFNVFVGVCYMTGLWTLALWLADTSPPALIAYAVLFGFFSGAYITLITALVLQVSPLSELGLRQGLIFLIGAVGALTTNPITGAISDSSIGWAGLKIFAGVFWLAGATFVLIARIRETGWRLLARF